MSHDQYIPQQAPLYNYGNQCGHGYPVNVPCQSCGSNQCNGDCPHQNKVLVKRQVVPMTTPMSSSKPYNLKLDFSGVPVLRGLDGYVYIDPSCAGEYVLKVRGEVAGFSGLSTFKVLSTNALSLTITETSLTNGLKEFTLSGNVPLQVNGALVDAPVNLQGYNFTDAPTAEIPVGHLPIFAHKGAGSTAGQVFFSVNSSGLAAQVTRSYQTVNYNAAIVNISVASGDPMKVASASNAVAVTGSDINNSINIGLRIDPVAHNDVRVTADGLLAEYTPEYIDTAANNSITSLDINANALTLPVGRLAIWDNDAVAKPILVRKVSNSGSNQWQALSSALIPNTPVSEYFVEGSNLNIGASSLSLASSPVPGTPVHVSINGQRKTQTVEYTVSGSTVTFTTVVASGWHVAVDYYV